MLRGWKRKLMNRLLAYGFTGSFGYAPASARNRGEPPFGGRFRDGFRA